MSVHRLEGRSVEVPIPGVASPPRQALRFLRAAAGFAGLLACALVARSLADAGFRVGDLLVRAPAVPAPLLGVSVALVLGIVLVPAAMLLRATLDRAEAARRRAEAEARTLRAELGDMRALQAAHLADLERAEACLQRQQSQLAALRAIDAVIARSQDARVALGALLDHVTAQLGVDAAAILVLNPQTRRLEHAAGRGFRGTAVRERWIPPGDVLAGIAALGRHPVPIHGAGGAPGYPGRAAAPEGEQFVSYCARPLTAKGHLTGLLEIFHRSPLAPDHGWLELLDALAGQAAIAVDNAMLFAQLQRSNAELVQVYDATLEGWARALDLRDRETGEHSRLVTHLTLHLAREMGVPEADLLHIRRGALLYDIGKMGIPDAILLKPGPPTMEEWEIMRLHPVYAYELLFPITYLRPALDIPYCHQ